MTRPRKSAAQRWAEVPAKVRKGVMIFTGRDRFACEVYNKDNDLKWDDYLRPVDAWRAAASVLREAASRKPGRGKRRGR